MMNGNPVNLNLLFKLPNDFLDKRREPLPLQDFIDQIKRMAELHPNHLWSSSMKEAAERLQEFKDIEDMLS